MLNKAEIAGKYHIDDIYHCEGYYNLWLIWIIKRRKVIAAITQDNRISIEKLWLWIG